MAVETITHDDVIEEEPEDVYDVDDDSEAEQYEFEYQEKIIIPSPKVSIDENDIPIIANNKVRQSHIYQDPLTRVIAGQFRGEAAGRQP